MSDPVQLAIVAGIVAITGSLVKRVFDRLDHLDAKVDAYHHEVNGKMTQLLNVSGDAREAKGNLRGRAEQKIEKGD